MAEIMGFLDLIMIMMIRANVLVLNDKARSGNASLTTDFSSDKARTSVTLETKSGRWRKDSIKWMCTRERSRRRRSKQWPNQWRHPRIQFKPPGGGGGLLALARKLNRKIPPMRCFFKAKYLVRVQILYTS